MDEKGVPHRCTEAAESECQDLASTLSASAEEFQCYLPRSHHRKVVASEEVHSAWYYYTVEEYYVCSTGGYRHTRDQEIVPEVAETGDREVLQMQML